MAVDIDKARRQNAPVGFDHLNSRRSGKLPDGGDDALPYGNIGGKRRSAAAVDHAGAANQSIKHGLSPPGVQFTTAAV